MAENKILFEQDSFWSWVRWIFQTYFARLLGINLVFLICCIPIITIPAALCGLHAVIQRFYRKQYAIAGIQIFFKEFLTSFVKRTVSFWSIVLVPYAAVRITWNILPLAVWYSLSAILLVAVILVTNWFIPQLVFLNLEIKHALKNAFLLIAIETRTNFALIAVHAICLTVLFIGLPITAFLLLILPAFLAVMTTGITMPVLKRYLVVPDPSQETVQ